MRSLASSLGACYDLAGFATIVKMCWKEVARLAAVKISHSNKSALPFFYGGANVEQLIGLCYGL